MFRLVVVTAAVSLVLVSAFKLEDFPQQYRELMPEQVKVFITGLTAQEQATMKEVHENFHSYKSDEEVVAAIKAKSPELAAKFENFESWIKGKAAALGPEARGYFDTLHENARRIRGKFYAGQTPSSAELKQAMLEEITKYKALSSAGKADFQKQFPILAGLLTNDEVYKHIQALN
ncbi:nematode fatty acid retinoid binding protein [Ancylostoma ceylanicum]|uniref:Fatty-acid and retinol-binding protein 1 n=2 Tax=Ancylostoma ceylanicum TaxID=53326 RepID=A0A0D6MD48_9BILA|nr:nematode fatty acid retinoid binding protein [Ancylostoma ceylanicum]EYC30412.1 hypothetical protein Y032_0005g2640 [Ancylostoma ceylanicum]